MTPPVGFMETVAKLAASSGESGKSMNSSALPTTDAHRKVSTLMASESSAGSLLQKRVALGANRAKCLKKMFNGVQLFFVSKLYCISGSRSWRFRLCI